MKLWIKRRSSGSLAVILGVAVVGVAVFVVGNMLRDVLRYSRTRRT